MKLFEKSFTKNVLMTTGCYPDARNAFWLPYDTSGPAPFRRVWRL
ncbi:hypothetical protein SXCC_01529 [Gluconacetobacter sp. SXCC-1]|nr:hypothetical protein SXCC_01529 [Gluconacetobacter sp. SXCC-1]